MTDLPGGEYINVVVMAERQPTSAVSREQAGRMKQRILEQERREARIASNARQREARGRLVIWLIPAVLALLLVVGALIGAKRACAQGRRHTEALEYWREPPDMSPAAAAALITDVMPGIQGSRAFAAAGNTPLISCTWPSRPSSPSTIVFRSDPGGIRPSVIRTPAAIGRSKRDPSFRTSAGDKLIVIRFGGREIPMFLRAVRTRSCASFTWALT